MYTSYYNNNNSVLMLVLKLNNRKTDSTKLFKEHLNLLEYGHFI